MGEEDNSEILSALLCRVVQLNQASRHVSQTVAMPGTPGEQVSVGESISMRFA